MATVTSDYQAHMNTAYFSYSEDLELYFISQPESWHCQNPETNPSMAMTVFSSSRTWDNRDQSLQLIGTCKLALDANSIKALNSYVIRFQTSAGWQRSLGQDDPGKNHRIYRFLVDRVKNFDEPLGGAALCSSYCKWIYHPIICEGISKR